MDSLDLTEFYEISAKYDDMNFAQLEKNNALILEIIQMEYPNFEEYDKFEEDLNAENQELEEYLLQHNDFLSKTMSYSEYISGMRNQVDERIVLIDKKFQKRYEPKVDKAFDDMMEIKRQFDEIPKIKESMQKEHNEVIKSLQAELELVNAQIREFYHKEKELMDQIAVDNAESDKVSKEMELIQKDIDTCYQLAQDIEDITLQDIPGLDAKIVETEEELKTICSSIDEIKDKCALLDEAREANNKRLSELDEQYAASCLDQEDIRKRANVLLMKNTIAEIEADDLLKDLVESVYYKQEKDKLIQLQADHMEIQIDLKNYSDACAEVEKKFSELTEIISNSDYEVKSEKLKQEMSQLIDLEIEMMGEVRQLKQEVDDGLQARNQLANDLEAKVLTLETRKVKVTNVMDLKIAEFKEKAEAKMRAKEEAAAKRKEQEEAAKKKAEEALKLKLAEEAAKKLAEEQKIAEEAAKKQKIAEEAAKKQKIAEEAAKQQKIAEDIAKKKLADEAKKKRADEVKKKKTDEAIKKKLVEETTNKLKMAEETAKKKLAEEAAKKKLAEDAAKKKLAEEAAKKKLAEEAAKKKLAEEAAKKKLAEEAAKKKLAEEALKKKLADEALKKKLAEEAANKLKLAEEMAKKKLAEEALKKSAESTNKTNAYRRIYDVSPIKKPRLSENNAADDPYGLDTTSQSDLDTTQSDIHVPAGKRKVPVKNRNIPAFRSGKKSTLKSVAKKIDKLDSDEEMEEKLSPPGSLKEPEEKSQTIESGTKNVNQRGTIEEPVEKSSGSSMNTLFDELKSQTGFQYQAVKDQDYASAMGSDESFSDNDSIFDPSYDPRMDV